MRSSSRPAPSDRPNPFRAFLPASAGGSGGARADERLCMVRSDPATRGELAADGLDRFLLDCAHDGVSIADLLDRLPCSRREGVARIERLIGSGALAIWTVAHSGAPRPRDTVDDDHETIRPRAVSGSPSAPAGRHATSLRSPSSSSRTKP